MFSRAYKLKRAYFVLLKRHCSSMAKQLFQSLWVLTFLGMAFGDYNNNNYNYNYNNRIPFEQLEGGNNPENPPIERNFFPHNNEPAEAQLTPAQRAEQRRIEQATNRANLLAAEAESAAQEAMEASDVAARLAGTSRGPESALRAQQASLQAQLAQQRARNAYYQIGYGNPHN